MYTMESRIGVTLPQAKRSCGINGPTLRHRKNFNHVKRTPRCLKLKYKNFNLDADVQWNHPPLAPPALGDIECQHTIN